MSRPREFMPKATYNKTFLAFDKIMEKLSEQVEIDIEKLTPKERCDFYVNLTKAAIQLTTQDKKPNKDLENAREVLAKKKTFGNILSLTAVANA